MLKKYTNITIRKKLLIIFLTFIIIPMVYVTFLIFEYAENSLKEAELSKLNAIADLKVDKINQYFNDLKTNVFILQDFWNIKKNMPVIIKYIDSPKNPQYLVAKKLIDNQLMNFQQLHNYNDLMLLNENGKLVYSSNPQHLINLHLDELNKILQPYFIKAKKEVFLSPIVKYKNQTSNSIELMTIGPVKDNDGKFIGYVVLEADLNLIYKILQEKIAMGESGENLIVQKKR